MNGRVNKLDKYVERIEAVTMPAFSNYTESGPPLLTDSSRRLIGTFTLSDTSTTIANTLRRCILVDTRSVGFRADLTNVADPGVVIRKNTSVIFNEMLAHRITLIPAAFPLDQFDPSQYECVLTVKNTKKEAISSSATLHVTASDFRVMRKQEDGSFADLGAPAADAIFPRDPITKQSSLIVSLRSQWNSEQPGEELDLTAYPVVGRGRDNMGFSPVSQCSFQNTMDTDPQRQEQFFHEWLLSFKKIADPAAVIPEALATHRKEWSNMAIQRCFLVDERGEPNSFGFTVESVGIRPVPEIVAEGIQAAMDLVTPYADMSKSLEDLAITTQAPDSRMNGLDLHFDGQEHTLGNLLQTLLADQTAAPDSPIEFAAYKIRHPLKRSMMLRLGFRDGFAGDKAVVSRELVAAVAAQARAIFEELAQKWGDASKV
jgi:DNA-directed RNA polymerase subunit L